MNLLHPDLHISPFKTLIFTNDSPSDQEAKGSEEFLDGHLNELSKRDEEIARVSALLNRLMLEQGRLQQYVTAHQAILSPIRRFPSEILAEIFMESLDDHYDVFDTKRGPWALGHVCRRWRDVSRSSPALWTSLSIDNLHLQPQLRHADLPAILEDVLALTRNRKLNIRYSLQTVIIYDDRNPESYPPKTLWCNQGSNSWDIFQLLFEKLVRHSTRWKTAWLVIPFKLGCTLQMAKKRLASLVSVDISPCNPLHYGSTHFNLKMIGVLSTAPKLQALTITPVPNTVGLPSIPCPQLRYLAHTLYASVEGHLRLLSETPLLETYKANFYEYYDWSSKTPLTHNSLRRLELCYRKTDVGPTLLECLTCPDLEAISLDLYHIPGVRSILYGFDNRSGCPLRQLSVKTKYPSGVDEWLLELAYKWVEGDLVSLPSLEMFYITIRDGEEETPRILSGLIQFIKARWDAGTSTGLVSLSMVIEKDNWAEFEIENKLKVLRQFKQEGLDVSVKRNGKQEV